jgi:hypothetical protein
MPTCVLASANPMPVLELTHVLGTTTQAAGRTFYPLHMCMLLLVHVGGRAIIIGQRQYQIVCGQKC